MGKTRAANRADHVEPHREDPLKFWHGELQSLCAECHDREKQREEIHGFSRDIGDDGWPIDPRHIFNRPRK
jgi:5-methylcytosine-specific restriction protein A